MAGPRETFMAAAHASLAAALPGRVVLRGLQDWAQLGDEALLQGVHTLVAENTAGWPFITGREGEYGTLNLAVVSYCRVPDDAENPTLAVEQMEAEMEAELLTWCQAIKPPPLDAVYPRQAQYSRGLEAPVGWIVLTLEGMYV